MSQVWFGLIVIFIYKLLTTPFEDVNYRGVSYEDLSPRREIIWLAKTLTIDSKVFATNSCTWAVWWKPHWLIQYLCSKVMIWKNRDLSIAMIYESMQNVLNWKGRSSLRSREAHVLFDLRLLASSMNIIFVPNWKGSAIMPWRHLSVPTCLPPFVSSIDAMYNPLFSELMNFVIHGVHNTERAHLYYKERHAIHGFSKVAWQELKLVASSE